MKNLKRGLTIEYVYSVAAVVLIALVGLSTPAVGLGFDIGKVRPIGTGISQGKVNATEQTLFEHTCETDVCAILHLWIAGSSVVDNTTFRFYVDGEATASIDFQVSLAMGVGFDDQSSPWATKWMGKGAKSTGWFNNFKIPFSRVKVTYQLEHPWQGEASGSIWSIVRGSEGLKQLNIGDIELPAGARLKLVKKDVFLQPLEFVDIVSVPKGQGGMLFMSSFQIQSELNFNFMEGCFHLYDDRHSDWPGMLLSTGMEDYFDSAFYFNGGNFHAPVSGSTHQVQTGNRTEWSGYRFHEMDPILFSDGMRFQWRNGDVTDPSTGLKCTQTSGTVCGNPQPSLFSSYAWIYLW